MEDDVQIDRIFEEGEPAVAFFGHTKEFNETPEFKIFEEVAKKFHPKVIFLSGETAEGTTKEFAEYFGVEGEKTEIVGMKAHEEGDLDKYIFKGELNAEDLTTWVQDLIDGKLVKTLKSEDIPEENKGPVKVIVGKNYADEVYGDKHVLVEFYAPWCGHCQEVNTKLKKN